MNLWLFLYTLRGGFPCAGGRLYAVAGCGQLDSVEYLELESSPVGGQPGPPGQLHLINIIHCNHQYLELNIYSRPIWTAQPIWGRLTMAICLSDGASKAFARGKFDVLYCTSEVGKKVEAQKYSNFSFVFFGKGREIHRTTFTSPCINLNKSMKQL